MRLLDIVQERGADDQTVVTRSSSGISGTIVSHPKILFHRITLSLSYALSADGVLTIMADQHQDEIVKRIRKELTELRGVTG